jgi:CBS domain-containing protein
MHVTDYMSQAASIAADQEYGAAFRLMQERGWEHAPVTDRHDVVVGVLSRRKAELAAYRFHTLSVEVGDVIEEELVTVVDTDPLSRAAERMAQHRVDVMLVLDRAGRPVGLLSDADLHRALADLLHGHAAPAGTDRGAA